MFEYSHIAQYSMKNNKTVIFNTTLDSHPGQPRRRSTEVSDGKSFLGASDQIRPTLELSGVGLEFRAEGFGFRV